MRELGIRCITRVKHNVVNEDAEHKVFPNILERKYNECTAPNQVWCADFTYLKKETGGFRYNMTIIDLYDRSPVATLNSTRIDRHLAMDTLKLAIGKITKKDRKKLILHTDQGSQYTSSDFRALCQSYGITQSMSRAGNPYDNAVMERFFNTLKTDFYNLYRWYDDDDKIDAEIKEFCHNLYYMQRPNRALDGLTPFEKRHGLEKYILIKAV